MLLQCNWFSHSTAAECFAVLKLAGKNIHPLFLIVCYTVGNKHPLGFKQFTRCACLLLVVILAVDLEVEHDVSIQGYHQPKSA